MFTLNIRGQLRTYDRPAVMGIINATPDSFFAGSRATTAAEAAVKTSAMVADGADFIDVGACSTRPGSVAPTAEEEFERLEAVLPTVKAVCGDRAVVSVDTYRAEVARRAVTELGADIVNDISGGTLDESMFDTIADLNVPYILQHMRGKPEDMQEYANYDNIAGEVLSEIGERVGRLSLMGVNDIIIDPGFGFAKNLEQNYELLANLSLLKLLHRPILVGLSRKSMATKLLQIKPEDALEATTALNMLALEHSAEILRVHDVKAAVQCIKIRQATACYENKSKF